MIQPSATRIRPFVCLLTVVTFFAISCSTVRNAPVNKPFVYESNVYIEGKYTNDEKNTLISELEQQLHDSIAVRKQRRFIFGRLQKNPPVFDTQNVSRSKLYMSTLLNSLGYYRDSIRADTSLDVVMSDKPEKTQQRVTVNFYVTPGTLIRLDSVWYDLSDSNQNHRRVDTLQEITRNNLENRLLKKGEPFSKPLISAELDRLSDVYRNNGYLRFSKDLLLAVWDTVGIGLIRPAIDPAEQLELLERLRQRREKPVADVEVRLRPEPDSLRLTRYYVGVTRIYTDLPNNPDDTLTLPSRTDTLTRNQYQFISYQNLFLARKLIRFISLHRGDLYKQSNYLKTQNKFTSIGAWRSVSIDPIPRLGQDTVDFHIRLIPADKYKSDVTLDVSRNQGNLGINGNLIGLGVNLSLLNRNFAKAGNQSTTNLRYGIEFSTSVNTIQTQQATLSHIIQFPRLVPRLRTLPISDEVRENSKSFLSLNLGYTDRINYYKVSSFNASFGYEFGWQKTILGLRIGNIEYNNLDPQTLLKQLILNNASYKYIFNDGLIVSAIVNATIAGGRKFAGNLFRASVEFSGIPGVIKYIDDAAKLYRFVKLDAEFVRTVTIRRSAIAWRLFGGVGYGLPFALKNGQPDSNNRYMPFFRQYYAGGPNSMRAWQVRRLGPGSSSKSFDADIAPDRFGDVRLEGNLEYRYFLFKLTGYTFEGALFTDVGNVWFLRPNSDFERGEFRLSRLWTDLGIGVGTGFRVDFGFLKLRTDFAWKAKDPSPADPATRNIWFYELRNVKWTPQFQLGINYPF